MTPRDIAALVAFAGRLADASGIIVRRYFRRGVAVVTKGDGSPVTRADREVETALRIRIERAFPDHGIFGEEHGRARVDARYQWVLDPIDGTKAFVAGLPVFGTLIALCEDDVPILGLIDQPILRERWIGARGRRTTFNGRPVSVRGGVALDDAVLASTTPDMFEGAKRKRHDRLAKAVSFCRYGIDCYAAGLMAMGHVDMVCEASLKPYDFCALVPVIEGAGGTVSDWNGKPLTVDSGETLLASANSALHARALALLGGAPRR